MGSISLILLSLPLLLGCTLHGPASSPAEGATLPSQLPADLADDLGVPIDQMTIQSHRRQTWSDGCLGLGGPAELCLAALTEGWQVEVIDNRTNDIYTYRTNLKGDHIRREP